MSQSVHGVVNPSVVLNTDSMSRSLSPSQILKPEKGLRSFNAAKISTQSKVPKTPVDLWTDDSFCYSEHRFNIQIT